MPKENIFCGCFIFCTAIINASLAAYNSYVYIIPCADIKKMQTNVNSLRKSVFLFYANHRDCVFI